MLNSLSDHLSFKVIIPCLKSGYQAIGEISTRIARCFSKHREKQVRALWVDPFSSETLLVLFKPIENLSSRLAKRIPTQNFLLHFLDQSLVSSAQHLYSYIKEVNHLLEIPKRIKHFIKTLSIDSIVEGASHTGGRIFILLNAVHLRMKKIVLFLLDYLIWIIDLFFQCILVTSQFEVLGYLREIAQIAREKIHQKFSTIAIKTIQKREDKIRRKIVANVADFTTKYIVCLFDRIVLKMGLGLIAYFGFEKLLHNSISIHALIPKTLAGALTAYFLWKKVYEPYLEDYYQAYKKEFALDRCDLKGFLNRYCVGYLYFPIQGVKNFLQLNH